MNLYKKILSRLIDPGRSYEERTLIMLAILGDAAMVIALVFNIINGESIVELLAIAFMIIAVPIVTALSVHYKKILLGSILQVCTLIFILLPLLFFFGGGPRGGGVFWIVFSYMFVGMSLSGRLRVAMMFCLTAISVGEYVSWFLHPEWVYYHDDRTMFYDSLVSVLLVGLCIYVMLMYLKTMFKAESAHALEEKERAEELNRSQNRFFSSMSHEIRTPINSIIGLNEIILRQEDASEEIIHDATNIQGAGKMLLALINDILDFSKIEAGSMDIVPVDYKVSDTVSEIVSMIWLRAHEKGLEFDVDIDPKVPSVLFGDEVRIKQIIINLLNNSIKYTQEGSIGLHMESEMLGDDHVRLIISVSDTGMGIKQEVIPYLFDAFKRVDQEKNRNIEGTGLGLSIVKQLTDLMDGTITVNSVYGQGTTIIVSLIQKITDATVLGNINISNSSGTARHSHEILFTAPEARVLIVDDNEMNLEVEKKLLADTKIITDTAISGKEALRLTLEYRYDAILMDHLMPEMDGIECLANIRKQTGGLNADVPIIVLTANAGSENIELYNISGFDGYLVKPVSGKQLEEMLVRHIPREKMILSESAQMNAVEMNTAQGYARKLPVVFASSSLCDLPDAVQKRLGIYIIPHVVITDEGVFRDNVELSADETVRYMENGHNAKSVPPETSEYVEFFSGLLRKAHHVIFISLTTSMSLDHDSAVTAAKSFENVTVINSESMSSSLSFLLLIGYKLAKQNIPVDKIIEELEAVKKRIKCSFIMGTTEYMQRKNLIGEKVHRIANSLDLHPALKFKDDKYGIGGLWMGSLRHCYDGYIKKCLPLTANPDTDIAFVTYVALPEEDLIWIEEQIRKRVNFEHIIFQQASASVTSNCGPGTFGILFMEKGDRSYNLSSLLPKEFSNNKSVDKFRSEIDTAPDSEDENESAEEKEKDNDVTEESAVNTSEEKKWYEGIDGIDGAAAVKNSGSEETFRSVLKLFGDSIKEKSSEIEGFYEDEKWDDYTIKVHALKSSARLVGALELAEEAQKLETAGKTGDIDYIRSNHSRLMDNYKGYQSVLSTVFSNDSAESGINGDDNRPVAEDELMKSVFEEIKSAAEEMDYDRLEGIFSEMEDYRIPDVDNTLYNELKSAFDRLDYDSMVSALAEKLL